MHCNLRFLSEQNSIIDIGRFWFVEKSLQWRHNGGDSVSNHQPHDCLLNRLFRRRSKKTSKIRVTGLCMWNSPGTGEFPAQMANYAENVSIWWRHHVRRRKMSTIISFQLIGKSRVRMNCRGPNRLRKPIQNLFRTQILQNLVRRWHWILLATPFQMFLRSQHSYYRPLCRIFTGLIKPFEGWIKSILNASVVICIHK